MIKIKFSSIILFVVLLTACKPEPVLSDTQGNKIDPKQWQNHWVLVNYWASWCEPCYKEIPALNQFYRLHHDHVLLYGVNYDGLTTDDLRQAIQKMDIEFPVFTVNPAQVLHIGETEVLPTTFVFNPQGRLVKTLIGPQTVKSLEKEVQNEQ
jgi:thiol-disulfide isomerase/thioredoxin